MGITIGENIFNVTDLQKANDGKDSAAKSQIEINFNQQDDISEPVSHELNPKSTVNFMINCFPTMDFSKKLDMFNNLDESVKNLFKNEKFIDTVKNMSISNQILRYFLNENDYYKTFGKGFGSMQRYHKPNAETIARLFDDNIIDEIFKNHNPKEQERILRELVINSSNLNENTVNNLKTLKKQDKRILAKYFMKNFAPEELSANVKKKLSDSDIENILNTEGINKNIALRMINAIVKAEPKINKDILIELVKNCTKRNDSINEKYIELFNNKKFVNNELTKHWWKNCANFEGESSVKSFFTFSYNDNLPKNSQYKQLDYYYKTYIEK